MADRPFTPPLSADLPEDWTSGQIVAPAGADVGLSQQHGYNYLMEQVNAVQRATNAINESFDTISGKRTCRVTVGASTAGWTQADCDYLCDGTDDQAELSAAAAAVRAAGGGEIAILAGEYSLSEEWTILAAAEADLTFSGEPGATVLNMENNIRLDGSLGELTETPIGFRGITFRRRGETVPVYYISNINVSAFFEGCRFLNVSINVVDVVSSTANVSYHFLFRGNQVETDLGAGADEHAVSISQGKGRRCLISGNTFKLDSGGAIRAAGGLDEVNSTPGAIIVDNVIVCDPSASIDGIWVYAGGCVANNYVYGARIYVDTKAACMGNRVKRGGIKASKSSAVAGNEIDSGNIVAGEYAAVTGNVITAPADTPAVILHRLGFNNTPESETAAVTGNIITAGSIGIYLSSEGILGANLSQTKALVSCNRITGCATSIQIDSNWSGCLVTGNMIDSSVVDKGTGNLVRLNSDDAGGGGGGGTAGVTSFNGRSGAVAPGEGDYTAKMVGAVPSGAVQTIQALTQAEYDALAQKDASALYLVKE